MKQLSTGYTHPARSSVIITLLVFLVSLFFLVSCAAEEKNIPFETIELQVETPGADIAYKGEFSRLQIISSLDDITTDRVMVSPPSQQILRDIDYDQYVVIIAYHGWIGTTGYGIEIKRMTHSDQTISVYTSLTRPKPDQLLGLAFTSPYHIGRLNRKDFPPNESLTFLFYTNGRLADKQVVSMQ